MQKNHAIHVMIRKKNQYSKKLEYLKKKGA